MQPNMPGRCVQVRRTKKGHNIHLDPASWADLMGALSIAIEVIERSGLPAERERAARLRALRSELSKG